MGNLSKIAGTVLGTTSLAALAPAADAAIIFENEGITPNNTFSGQSLSVNDEFRGSNNGTTDPIDFLNYSGLPVGGSFDFKIQRTFCGIDLACAFPMQAGLFTDQTTMGDFVTLDVFGLAGEKDLTGLVPAVGQLTLGVTLLTGGAPAAFEGYSVILTVTPPNFVSQPATIALLLAGLTGLQVLRRRKRR